MQRKRTILILTSKDELGNESKCLANAIKKIGTRNVVVMSDDKYGSAVKMSALDRLMDRRGEYQYLLERKDKGVIRDKFRFTGFSKRVNRINNMVKRFKPEYILCNTPYSHHCVVDAKRKARFKTQIVYLMHSFTAPTRVQDDLTNVFIVENSDVKVDLVRKGVRSKDVMVMGLPYDIKKKDEVHFLFAKQELGLPKAKTVFVNIKDKHALERVYSLLVEQGKIINLVVYLEDAKLRQQLSQKLQKHNETTVLFISTKDRVDEYLSVCDVLLTSYDISLVYKAMKLAIVPIILSHNEHEMRDINYLVNKELCFKAKDEIDTVALVYKAFQSEAGERVSANGPKWVEMSSIDNIASFLVSYIAL